MNRFASESQSKIPLRVTMVLILSLYCSNGGSANGTPTKRVSFMNSDSSDPVANERVSRLENVEKDPNVS